MINPEKLSKPRPAELTNMRCEKAASRPMPYRLADRGGLHLLVTPAGGKLWRWKYRFEGKEKQMALGKYPNVPLAKARVLHAQARALLAAGADPMATRKEAKEKKRSERVVEEQSKEFTFKKLMLLWFAKWEKGKNRRYAACVESRLIFDVIGLEGEAARRYFADDAKALREYNKIPHVGWKRPTDVTLADLVELTKATNGRGARDIAKRNVQMIRKIIKWGKSNNLLPPSFVNPAADIDLPDILSDPEPVKFAHLKINEVPELLCRMREYNGNALTRIAMELLSLTFVRTGEMIAAEWTEINWERRAWLIPEEHMKMKRPHIVPLSTQATALLERLHSISGGSGRLFPDYNGGLGTMSKNTVLFALKRMGYQGRMTGHGWRHIASTYLRSAGYDKFMVELQLSHLEGGVAGIYNEWEVFEKRAAMMQAWADALDEMRDAGAGKMRLVRTAA